MSQGFPINTGFTVLPGILYFFIFIAFSCFFVSGYKFLCTNALRGRPSSLSWLVARKKKLLPSSPISTPQDTVFISSLQPLSPFLSKSLMPRLINNYSTSASRWRVFSTFLECSQMSGVFYHSVIHGLGFFICFMI